VAFAGVVDGEVVGAEDVEEVLEAGDDGADGVDVVALIDEIAFGGTDWMVVNTVFLGVGERSGGVIEVMLVTTNS
jgi:hypothetical protein